MSLVVRLPLREAFSTDTNRQADISGSKVYRHPIDRSELLIKARLTVGMLKEKALFKVNEVIELHSRIESYMADKAKARLS